MGDVTSTPTSPDDAEEFAVLTFRRREYRVRAGQTVREAIVQCGLQPDDVLITRNGVLVESNVMLQAGDRVRLLPIISGG